MVPKPPSTRTLLFGAALFAAGALATSHIRSVGQETGILRFGARQLREVSRTNDPQDFEFWSNFFAASTFGFVLAAIAGVWLAWYFRKKRGPRQ